MKRTIFSAVVALAMAFTVSVATACPKHEAAAKAAAEAAAKVAAKAPVSDVKTVADDGRSETATAPAGDKKATKVSGKASPCGKDCAGKCDKPCGSKCGKDCDKPCCKDAKKVAGKAPCHGAKTASGKSPCSGKKATTVSADASPCGKDCDKPCCKDAKKVSAKAGKKGCCGKKANKVADKGGCPIEAKTKAVLASMPAIEYRVGTEVTGCSKTAAAMADKSGKPLEYVIGKEGFKKEGEAIARLTALLEETATDMQSVQYVAGGKCGRCPMTAKSIAKASGTKVAYRVGGVDFENKADAEKVAKLVADAAKTVSMTYKVDGKSFKCDKMAGAKCKKSGKKMTFVVGDKETECSTSAKLMKAEAKIRKIIETASAASFSL